MNSLKEQVAFAVSNGAVDCSSSLGIRKMPDGYALMWDGENYYYWLRHDGQEGLSSWDKWYCYRSAKMNASGQIVPTNTTQDK